MCVCEAGRRPPRIHGLWYYTHASRWWWWGGGGAGFRGEAIGRRPRRETAGSPRTDSGGPAAASSVSPPHPRCVLLLCSFNVRWSPPRATRFTRTHFGSNGVCWYCMCLWMCTALFVLIYLSVCTMHYSLPGRVGLVGFLDFGVL